MDTVALFGGSFDPPHIGHEAIVRALNALEWIDKVVVMPTFLNPFKLKFYAPAPLRVKWLREAFSEYAKVEISEFEVNQQKKVPTIQSVLYLLKTYKKVFVVIGADNILSLYKWYRYDELKNLATFIVASRDDVEIPSEFLRLDVREDISSTALRDNMDLDKLPKKCSQEIFKYYKEINCKKE